MHLRLIAVGKLREAYAAQACAEFRKRLASYYPYEEHETRAADGSDPPHAMQQEAARILKLVRPDDRVWLLERSGTETTSQDLSRRLTEVANSGASRLTLIIGGAYGADPAIHARAEFAWSLSKLTFLHEWARMIVLEQLYRAAKIARNEPYHH
jgi:23S rRNA (pseudouridine1915-N3)-methyltransferase